MYEVVSIRAYQDREGNEKTAFTKLGAAFEYRQGEGYMVKLEALPVPTLNADTGQLEYILHLRPPYTPDQQGRGGSGRAPARGGGGYSAPMRNAPQGRSGGGYGGNRGAPQRDEGIDDEIPF